jgi:hypothetical protein
LEHNKVTDKLHYKLLSEKKARAHWLSLVHVESSKVYKALIFDSTEHT